MWSKILLSAAVVHAIDDPVLSLLQKNAKVQMSNKDDSLQSLGSTVPLTESGYQLLASTKNDDETSKFIERVALAEARTVTDAGALSGLAPYYSGTMGVQSLENLKKELRTASWVGEGEGRRAPLNELGYQAVVGTNDEAQMVAFARRILDAHGKQSHDESMMKGLMPWFSGKNAVQSFDKLQSELVAAIWAESRQSREEAEMLVSTGVQAQDERNEWKNDTELSEMSNKSEDEMEEWKADKKEKEWKADKKWTNDTNASEASNKSEAGQNVDEKVWTSDTNASEKSNKSEAGRSVDEKVWTSDTNASEKSNKSEAGRNVDEKKDWKKKEWKKEWKADKKEKEWKVGKKEWKSGANATEKSNKSEAGSTDGPKNETKESRKGWNVDEKKDWKKKEWKKDWKADKKEQEWKSNKTEVGSRNDTNETAKVDDKGKKKSWFSWLKR